ncbi:hypothetical protein OG601_46050 [Streptomyces sp. NBC_01239]|uniref:hypothetical protein n=1 Tax=Streptomyces sp. NBC_01239 TaxID=2903792 RepID=UPI002256EFC7|nr:hypothetical protein [Streptomyces sp. NBC_01239]MCX4817953.1 hypothetical protein [Streptomyces sp. NBC_01239]
MLISWLTASGGVRRAGLGTVPRWWSPRPHGEAGNTLSRLQTGLASLDDYRIVADQLTGEGKRSTADRVAVPYTLFMTPPPARAGLTERQARAAGRAVRVAKDVATLMAMPRADIMGDTRGMTKFVLDADTDEILGAAILSIDAQELINTVASAMRAGVTGAPLCDSIWTHPSATEAFNEVLATIVRLRRPGRGAAHEGTDRTTAPRVGTRQRRAAKRRFDGTRACHPAVRTCRVRH